ncbi:hypothetical protein ES288_A05G122000v1 [Gossypium darwinii]|nr:hypothetical protein ES288_A05G122000v1 [Gossypium darwinii]
MDILWGPTPQSKGNCFNGRYVRCHIKSQRPKPRTGQRSFSLFSPNLSFRLESRIGGISLVFKIFKFNFKFDHPNIYFLGKGKMSSYENVVGGKLKLKGKALDVKAGGIKKKKKHKKQIQHDDQITQNDPSDAASAGETTEVSVDPNEEDINNAEMSSGEKAAPHYDDHLTPAERRYIEQREQLDVHRLAKQANKSHRDRIQDFNQYLANMSEHYDIPKVGPG